ncbi:crotonase/enoyl-CoA hydratase family protein [Thermodesulfobacteriota bacterium]
MEFTQIRYEIDRNIAKLTLDRPDNFNAFTPTMRKELVEAFSRIDQDDTVRAVVVTGAGKAFCAGADLSAGAAAFERTHQEGRKVEMRDHRDGGGQVSLAVFGSRKPVIAAINGHAVGVGITMTLPMDIRIAAEDAKIGFVFTRRGVIPEACSTWFLPRIVGVSKAAELMYTGRLFRAADESHSGLFNAVVPRAEVLPKAMAIAEEIAQNTSAVSVALTRALLWRGLAEDDPHSAHLTDSRLFYWVGQQKDAREGIQSFLEKRPPNFTMSPSSDMPEFYPWWKEPKV